jgi:uncharacterized membrane protein
MGKLSDAKILGGIGSILQIIPYVSIVGYILTLIAVKFISDEVHDSSIFNDMLFAAITGIVGVAIAAVGVFGAFASIAVLGAGAIVGIIAFLAVAWIALIISAIFIRKAFNKIAAKLNIGTFRTAGTLYFIGAILTIVLVGFIILFIAYILQIVAFFSINEAAAQPQGMQARPMSPATPMAASSPPGGTKFCVNCGTEMGATVAFCPKCGAKQP